MYRTAKTLTEIARQTRVAGRRVADRPRGEPGVAGERSRVSGGDAGGSGVPRRGRPNPIGAAAAAVIDHVTLQVSDVAASRRFYDPLLATLGVTVEEGARSSWASSG